MHLNPRRPDPKSARAGFTLLELLIAVTLLATAFAIIWGSFSITLDAWRRGGELTDRLHRGDFVFDRIELALRSTAWFPSKPDRYGFRLDASGEDEARFSWVTTSGAFRGFEQGGLEGMHRLQLGMEDDESGRRILAVRSFHPLADVDASDEEGTLLIGIPDVQGIRCEVYNKDDEEWVAEWENTNAVPDRIRVTVILEPLDGETEPVELQRAIQIPAALAAQAQAPNTRAAQAKRAVQRDLRAAQQPGSQPSGAVGGRSWVPGPGNPGRPLRPRQNRMGPEPPP